MNLDLIPYPLEYLEYYMVPAIFLDVIISIALFF